MFTTDTRKIDHTSVLRVITGKHFEMFRVIDVQLIAPLLHGAMLAWYMPSLKPNLLLPVLHDAGGGVRNSKS